MAQTSDAKALKVKKDKKRKADEVAEEPIAPPEPVEQPKQKKEKKRKVQAADGEGGASPLGPPEAQQAPQTPDKPRKKVKKQADANGDADVKHTADVNGSGEVRVAVPVTGATSALSLDRFELSDSVKSLLRSQGIESLFAIQAHTLPAGLTGKDVVGRARTGCGKTLGFTLPIVERLLREQAAGKFNSSKHGRLPSVLVMAPTRELAKQVNEVFTHIGKAAKLSVVCVYGGSPYETQESALRRGADVVVGTPGRIKDLLARGSLKLTNLRYRVLDEVDAMLQMGFVEDVEAILSAAPTPPPGQAGGSGDGVGGIQTYLFSATMPRVIKSICQRFLAPGHTFVDLVGDDKAQAAATTVRHLMLPAHWQQRNQLVKDLITSYGCGGRTIVFTDTKSDAGSLALILQDTVGAQALHGDLAQKMREQALAGFRSGRFPVLVATDVAARGLDITGVELVIMVDPPSDWETYIHRSGRTGRAGHTGTCITLVTRKMEYMVPIIEAKGRFKFERIGAPQPADMARVAAERAVEVLVDVSDTVIPFFTDAARKFLEQAESPVDAVARALAHITGHKEMKARSLLTAHDDSTTLMFTSATPIQYMGAVWGYLKKVLQLDEGVCESVRRLTLTADGKGAVFDVPTAHAARFLDAASKCTVEGLSLTAPATLPELKQSEITASAGPSYGGNGYRNGYGSGGSGGGNGQRRNGYGSGGQGRGGGYGGRGGGYSGGRGGGGRGMGFSSRGRR